MELVQPVMSMNFEIIASHSLLDSHKRVMDMFSALNSIRAFLDFHLRNNHPWSHFITDSTEKPESALIVDIQPEYQHAITFNLKEMLEFISKQTDNFYVMYNGKSVGVGDTEGSIKDYYRYSTGQELDFLDWTPFYDKGFGFIRDCIDGGFANADIIKLVKYMLEQNIKDAADMDFKDAIKSGTSPQLLHYLESHSGTLRITEVFDILRTLPSPILLVGGHFRACLLEIVLALCAMGIPYILDWNYIF